MHRQCHNSKIGAFTTVQKFEEFDDLGRDSGTNLICGNGYYVDDNSLLSIYCGAVM